MHSYKNNSNHMHGASLVTGEQSSHRVPSYTFEYGCYWSEVPGGSLLITGGGYAAVREVVRIGTRREFAVAHCPPMLTLRSGHTAVYYTQHLYVLGGLNGRYLSVRGTSVKRTDGKLCLHSLELAVTRVE
jgi:hypothetical protein